MTDYYETSYPPDLWMELPPSTNDGRDSASPGDSFTEDDVTAQDSANAGKLTGLGFVAVPATAWTVGQKITVNGTFSFYWNGTAWVAGAAPVGTVTAAPWDYTIAEIQAWVDDNPDDADEVLAAEQSRGTSARVTLVDWLQGFISHRDEGTLP